MSTTDSAIPTVLSPNCGAALFLVIWEWFITLDDEVNLIWPKPNDSWLKWLFFFSRYYILTAMIVSRSLEAAIVYHFPLGKTCIKIWYSCQVLVGLHAMCALEIALMTRVYALYNKPIWMRRLFFILVVSENLVVLVGMFLHFPGDSFHVDQLLWALPPSFSYFGFCTLAIQVVIMYFTLRKYLSGSWQTVPIVQLMFRDGSLSFSVLTLLVIVMSIFTVKSYRSSVAGFAWLLAAMSCVTCRVTINMQKLSREFETPEHASTGIQFTTFVASQNSLARSRPMSRSSSYIDEAEMSRMGFPVGGMMVAA